MIGKLCGRRRVADMEAVNACHGRFVRAEDSGAEVCAEADGCIAGEGVDDAGVSMFHVDNDHAREGRIGEIAPFGHLFLIHAAEVIVDDLSDEWQLCIQGLQEHTTALLSSARASCHLCQHLISALVGSEIGLVEHGIGREYADDADMLEVESFRNHLCAHEDVGFSACEGVDDLFVGCASACCI